MKSYSKLVIAAVILFAGLFALANLLISDKPVIGRPYVVEAERLCRQIEADNKIPSLSGCEYINGITLCDGSEEFWSCSGECLFRQVGGAVYRFEYDTRNAGEGSSVRLIVNISLAAAALLTFGLLIYIGRQIIRPFNDMSDLPYQLSRGNLGTPLKEIRSRYFGRYIWGTDMLRESIEQQRRKELELQKEKQTLLLSISHDIKTPLSAIKLYSSALTRGLYKDEKKLEEIYRSIGEKALEIEKYTAELTRSAGEDFLALEVRQGECYLSELIDGLRRHYADMLRLTHTELETEPFGDVLLSCDADRAAEVLQNLMENALKYGDGRKIRLTVSQEEDCRLITVTNGGCTLSDEETLHIFDSFWRGSNSGNKPGSGLGLYICRQLMSKMGGSIFARCRNGEMSVTAVFRLA